MYRRRRPPPREIAFSFDSFLDVVANVVGIILRLILVAWVGARAYKAVVPDVPPPPPPTHYEEVASKPVAPDPLADEIERRRRELEEARKRLLAQLSTADAAQNDRAAAAMTLDQLAATLRQLDDDKSRAERARAGLKAPPQLALSMGEIQKRTKALQDEIDALKKAPPTKKSLRYKTPISQTLQSEELFFECRNGRVTPIDIGTLVEDVRKRFAAEETKDALRTRGRYAGATRTVGAFRLQYQLDYDGSHVELTWEVDPQEAERGERLEQALMEGSRFRRIADTLDAQQTAVTFWVYPDSFALYRQLRDYLYEKDVVVAGRALPMGVPIMASPKGTASRGQ